MSKPVVLPDYGVSLGHLELFSRETIPPSLPFVGRASTAGLETDLAAAGAVLEGTL